MKKINEAIEEVFGNRVKEQQKYIFKLAKNIDKTKREIFRLEVGIKRAERDAKKLEQRIKTRLDIDIKNCEQQILNIQQEKQNSEVIIQIYFMDPLQELNDKLDKQDKLLKKLKTELIQFEAKEGKLKSFKIDLDKKINEKKRYIKRS